MIVLDDFNPVPVWARGAFLAVGNFDGVHRGHAQLIGRLRALADAARAPAIALTFDPSPAAVLRPGSVPPALTWPARKADLLVGAGASEVAAFRTGRWLLSLTAREFFERVILNQFGARGMVEGPTFGFGRDRGGDAALLGTWCAEAGLAFEVAEPIVLDGAIVSSSRIRWALDAGRVDEAAALLGRPHRLRGVVVRGEGRGRTLGFPTANLAGVDTQIPADGVYAALARLEGDGRAVAAALHIGRNLTFGAEVRTVEAHLIDFSGVLYDRTVTLDLLALLRPSRKFDGIDALVAQMRSDVAHTRAIVAESGV